MSEPSANETLRVHQDPEFAAQRARRHAVSAYQAAKHALNQPPKLDVSNLTVVRYLDAATTEAHLAGEGGEQAAGHEVAAFGEAVRAWLAALVGSPDLAGFRKEVVTWVEEQVEGFAEWYSDEETPKSTAEAALQEATGLDDLQAAGEAATVQALGLNR